jgi:predicted nucleic acid-binding protein
VPVQRRIVRIFLDASVVLAACGRLTGGSRAVFDLAAINGWRLLTSPYVLTEVAKNLPKLPPSALVDWPTLSSRLTVTRDVWTMDRPAVFSPAKDRPVLFTAAAWAKVLLTLDTGDFGGVIETGFYHLTVMRPGLFLERERAVGRLKKPS